MASSGVTVGFSVEVLLNGFVVFVEMYSDVVVVTLVEASCGTVEGGNIVLELVVALGVEKVKIVVTDSVVAVEIICVVVLGASVLVSVVVNSNTVVGVSAVVQGSIILVILPFSEQMAVMHSPSPS